MKPIISKLLNQAYGIIETPKKLYISGFGHEKDTLSPIFGDYLTQFVPEQYPYCGSFNRTMMCDLATGWPVSSWICNKNLSDIRNGVYLSKYDEYAYLVLQASNRGLRVAKLHLSDESIADVFYVDTGTGYPYAVVAGENSEKLVILARRTYYSQGYLFTINKSSLTVSASINLGNYSCPQFIAENNGKIYYAVTGFNTSGRVDIRVHDIATNTSSILATRTGSGFRCTPEVSQPIIDGNKLIGFVAIPNNPSSIRIYRYTIDLVEGKAELKETEAVALNLKYLSDYRRTFACYIISNSTGKYLSLIEYGNISDNARIWTWKINDDYSLVYKSTFEFNTKLNAFMPLGKTYLNFVATSIGTLYVLTFTEEGTYKVLETMPINCRSVNQDLLGRIWVTSVDGQVYLLSDTAPATIDIKVTPSTYEYTGSSINATVSVSAYNWQGQRISIPVKVVCVTDNIRFSDGSKEKVVTTSTDSDVTIDAVIIKPGLVQVTAIC